jgi:hypothetical protein
VTGQVDSPTANGVFGGNSATTGFAVGVGGSTSSAAGAGVNGYNAATSGSGAGVVGASASPQGVGVSGSGGSGVLGVATSTGGNGLTAQNKANNVEVYLAGGVPISAFMIGAGTELFDVDGSGNGYFAGDLYVAGNLSKGGGSFKIDHPLDPANKYLSHSFVESPDMMNVYNGVVVLDAHGSAWITLPDYFEALNSDFRYQLTAVGVSGPNLYIARKVSNNRFKIAGGKPHAEVSWQVTGIRHDAYANAYRIPTEEDKATAEQGYYLHPEVFGQPASKRIRAARQMVSSTGQLAHVSNP